MKRLLLLSLVLLLGYTVCGRNHYFSHLTMDEGLSHNCVKSIVQDSYGFVWIGTKNGLCRYDGAKIRVIKCMDSNTGNGNNNINALFENSGKELWCGTDKGIYIWSFRDETFREFDAATPEGTRVSDWVAAVDMDKDGNIWMVVPSQGVFRYRDGNLDLYSINLPQSLCVRKNGQVWIGTYSEGLFTYNPDSGSFEAFHTDKYGNTVSGEYIYSICEWGSSLAIAIHDKELKKLDFKTMKFSTVNAPEVHNTLLRDIRNFDNDLWITSHEGIFIIDGQTGEVSHIKEDVYNPYGLSDKTCSTLYRDTEGGIWVGTMLGGVNYCASENFYFDKYILYDKASQVYCNQVRTMTEGPDGKIWIGTEDEGICVFDPATGKTQAIGYGYAQRHKLLNTLGTVSDGTKLWFGLFKRGIGEIDMTTGRMRQIDPLTIGIGESSIYSFLHDTHGRTWVGTASGVYVRDAGEKSFRIYGKLKDFWAFDIYEDSRKNIWFASLGGGIYRYESVRDELVYYSHDSRDRNSLSSNSVSSIYEDSRGYIWCSTDRGGLNRYDYVTDSFRTYSVEDGLPDDVTYKVMEDKAGNLWFGTNKGLVRLDPDNDGIRVFTKKDGLLGNQFNYHAVTRDSNGLLWFGGMDGIISFDPLQNGSGNTSSPNIFITGFEINNRRQFTGDEDAVLDLSPMFTERLVLRHDQSNLKIDFADVRFTKAKNTRYYYRMEPMDADWVEVTGERQVSFARLNPGNYTFRIMAVAGNGQKHTGEKAVSISVRQPWWYSATAKTIYTVILSCTFVFCIIFWYRRKNRQMSERQHLFEVEKEKELYSSKIDFFNEIAHELRTPLTLIKGPLEDIIVQNEDPKMDKQLHTISRNTDRLLELVNQLLDFRKVDAKKVQMIFTQFDIPLQLRSIVERFEPVMEKQGKKFTMTLAQESFQAIADKESFTKIVSNLLNNAVKYSERNISLELTHGNETFSVRITSDGAKIPLHLSEKIFEPFFRMDTTGQTVGTGIGLPMARSLAQMHKGLLRLDSMADGNSFVLTLPIVQEGFTITEEQKESYIIQQETDFQTASSDYSVLIVEDNAEIRNYIVDNLRDSCVVLTASDGEEAIEMLRDHKVDIVVTDIMMPKMDGMELCRQIKKDESLRSTPVVFITAKNDMKTKIEGLKIGAEAFIEKPFSFGYLSALIFSIMDNRRQEREEYSRNPLAGIGNIKMSAGDEAFMNELIGIIEADITSDITVEWLAEKTFQSPSSLLRRIKKLTGQSIPEFINLVKMKRAAKILTEGYLKVSEVCYAVGINSPSYFSRLFSKQFGMLPKDFMKQHIKK